MSVTGIVIAGGKSSRMGAEKGLQLLAGKPLIGYALETLASVCSNILISSNSDAYATMGYEIVADEITDIGPIGGLYSALKQSKTEQNLILSCDLPFVNSELLLYLLQKSEGYRIVVPWQEGNHYEPLCAFYNKLIVPDIEENIKLGNHKLSNFFQKIKTNKLIINDKLPFYSDSLFFNVNAPTELIQAENIMAKAKII